MLFVTLRHDPANKKKNETNSEKNHQFVDHGTANSLQAKLWFTINVRLFVSAKQSNN